MKKTKLPTARRLAFIVLFAAFALAAACQQQTEQPGAQQQSGGLARERVAGTPGGSLAYRVSMPVKTLNPLMFSDEASYIVAVHLLNSRLADFDHDTQKYAPGLAESWQMGADGKTLDVTLRDGLKFSDGRPLTTEDVAFTLRAMYDERVGSPILGAGLVVGDKQIEATTQDARRMRLVFPEVVAAPETYLINMVVLPRHVVEEDLKKAAAGGEAQKNANAAQSGPPKPPPVGGQIYSITTDPQHIVTAGPFVVESVAPGERVTLKRNPHYWKKDAAGNQLPYLDKLVIETIADPNAAVTRLREGGLDIYDRLRPNDYAAMQGAQGQMRAYDVGPGLTTDQIIFNLNPGQRDGKPIVSPTKRAWFNDLRFRRAVAHAIDRQTISTTTLQGLATPLYGPVSPGNREWAAQDLPRAEYDLEKARALLREAGFTIRGTESAPELFDAGGNRVEFTLLVQATNDERKAIAAVVQEDLARLGIRMQVAPAETREVTTRLLESYDFDAILFGVITSDTDPSSYGGFLKSSSENHQWYPKQPKPATDWEAQVDKLVDDLSRETSREKRHAIFRDIQHKFVENMPVVPVTARHVACAAHTRIGNYRPSNVIPYSLWNAEELFVRK